MIWHFLWRAVGSTAAATEPVALQKLKKSAKSLSEGIRKSEIALLRVCIDGQPCVFIYAQIVASCSCHNLGRDRAVLRRYCLGVHRSDLLKTRLKSVRLLKPTSYAISVIRSDVMLSSCLAESSLVAWTYFMTFMPVIS